MKRILFFTAILLIGFLGIAKTGLSNQSQHKISLIESNNDYLIVSFELLNYSSNSFVINGEKAFVFNFEDAVSMLQKGNPDVYKISKSIWVASDNKFTVEILNSESKNINDIIIAPSKGNLLRTINPDEVPYSFSKIYKKNDFYPGKLCELGDNYQINEVKGRAMSFFPFQYNPVQKKLKIYNKIIVKISAKNGFVLQNPIKLNSVFSNIYSHHFLNNKSLKYTPVNDEGNMLIITDPAFENIMQEFVQWKNMRGIETEMITTDIAGTTAEDIFSYVSNYYEQNGLTFLLLIGDAEQIPPREISDYDSDAAFGHIVGTDSYAEIIVGRFSGSTISEIQTQIDRSIYYESSLNEQDDWLNKFILVASSEGPGDNDEYDYEHLRNIETDLLGYTYISGDEMFQGDQGGNDADGNPNQQMVVDALNSGRGIFNYIGHGSDYSMATSGFGISSINTLENTNKLPFVFDVACVNGNFKGQTCFAEAFMRASHNNKPTGAIAIIASTINQSWNPPMAGQDEMNDILTESYAANIKRTFGGIAVNGCMYMNDQYGNSGAEITDTWTIFGDPSLMVRTTIPKTISEVSYPFDLFIGASKFKVLCNENNCTASIVQSGKILASAKLSNGEANFEFEHITSNEDMIFTITGYNYQTIIDTLTVNPNEQSYVILDSYEIFDENQNQLIDYDENISVSITAINSGMVSATDVYGKISTISDAISFTSDSVFLGFMGRRESKFFENIFAFKVDENIIDGEEVEFIVSFTDSKDSVWVSTFRQTLNAPKFNFEISKIINSEFGNANNVLDQGELNNMLISFKNIGHSNSSDAYFKINILSNNAVLLKDSLFVDFLVVEQVSDVEIPVIVNSNAETGNVVSFEVELRAGNYFVIDTINFPIGIIIEDFESGDFSAFNWNTSLPKSWIIEDSTITSAGGLILPYRGTYMVRSEIIGAGSKSEFSISLNVIADDTISFYKKVSSEFGGSSYYDFLDFMIDNESVGKWHGEVSWSKSAFCVEKGNHTFTWRYRKDSEVDGGNDAAWVDNIKLPSYEGYEAPHDTLVFITTPIDSAVAGGTYNYSFEISTNLSDTIPVEVILLNKPDWLTFIYNDNKTGTISGIPTSEFIGNYEIIFLAKADNLFGFQKYTLRIVSGIVINEQKNDNEFIIYPNPFQNQITIYSEKISNYYKARVYNIMGILIYESNIVANTVHTVIFPTNISKGIYILEIEKESGENIIRRIIKK